MAAGEWISISAQNELAAREISIERREIAHNPRAEQAELAKIYEGHGMEPSTAMQAASEVMRSADEALIVHAREELGVDPHDLPSAPRAAALSFFCFVVGALLPVVPWFVGTGTAAKVTSVLLGIVAAGCLGFVIGTFGSRSRRFTVVRQMLILIASCAVTYLVGSLLNVNVS
jgi:VIT1/CCC1 family predicted Fe2+/Mn2+ transporter